eukprot:Skav200653  [mRNA]  locus=scaffold2539:144486:146393:+ [translate_table: standard]
MKPACLVACLVPSVLGTSFLRRDEEHALAPEPTAGTTSKPIFGPQAYVIGIIAPGSFLVGLGAVIALRYYERHNPGCGPAA